MSNLSLSATPASSETLILQQHGAVLYVTLNRSEQRNAMSAQMLNELIGVFSQIKDDLSIRAVVLRGAGGHFCAGGDIKDMAALRMAAAQAASNQPYIAFNRLFGTLIETVNHAPQIVVAVLEGAVLGGGFGLACVSDLAISFDNAQFGLPETGLGVIPAQIAPFVVQRIGITQARRVALLGLRFNGAEAVRLGIAHTLVSDEAALQVELNAALQQIQRAAPNASRVTKALLHQVAATDLSGLLDQAAVQFAEAVGSAEGMEGTMAFIQKRLPNWAE